MNSSAILVVLSGMLAVALAQVNCPNCGPIQDPITPCGVPDCTIPANRQHFALFPHPDPNYYWQCAPLNATHWAALARRCACGSVFNPFVLPERRCTFWFSDNWRPICNWQDPPTVIECDPWCPDCNGDQVTQPPPPLPTPPPPGDDGNNCECPCVPCVWWPCQPCQPSFNCPCNNNRRG